MLITYVFVVILFLILMWLAAFFAALEASLLSLGRVTVRLAVEKNVSGARTIQKMLDNPKRVMSTVILCATVFTVCASSIATYLMVNLLGVTSGIVVVSFIVSLFIFVFCKQIPKTIAFKNEKFTFKHANRVKVVLKILYPVIVVLVCFADFVIKSIGCEIVKDVSITKEYIEMTSVLSEEQGNIQYLQKKMLHKILEADKTIVTKIIVPIDKIVSIKKGETIENAIHLMIKTRHSRLPVYEHNKNNIVGLIYIGDLPDYGKNASIDKFIRPILKVKHDETIERLLSRMEQYNIRRAIVADKNNETVGFVAMQDILKEIIVKIPTKSTKVSVVPERINT